MVSFEGVDVEEDDDDEEDDEEASSVSSGSLSLGLETSGSDEEVLGAVTVEDEELSFSGTVGVFVVPLEVCGFVVVVLPEEPPRFAYQSFFSTGFSSINCSKVISS